MCQMPVFADLDSDVVTQILNIGHVKRIDKGALLFQLGDSAAYFYVVIDGWVKLYRETRDGHEHVLRLITVGEILGKAAIIKNNAYNYSATCETASSLLLIPSSMMWRMVEHKAYFNDLQENLLKAYFDDINQLELRSEHLIYLSSTQRVGCHLLRRCGNKTEGSASFQIPVKKSLIAESLSMSKETFSRSLNQLSARGVEVKGSRITIHNIAQLRAFVCEHCSALLKECFMGTKL